MTLFKKSYAAAFVVASVLLAVACREKTRSHRCGGARSLSLSFAQLPCQPLARPTRHTRREVVEPYCANLTTS